MIILLHPLTLSLSKRGGKTPFDYLLAAVAQDRLRQAQGERMFTFAVQNIGIRT